MPGKSVKRVGRRRSGGAFRAGFGGFAGLALLAAISAGCGGSSAPTTSSTTTRPSPSTTRATTTTTTVAPTTTTTSSTTASAPAMAGAAVGVANGQGTVSITYNQPVSYPAGAQGDFVYTQLFSGGSGPGAGEAPPASGIACSGATVVLTFAAVTSMPLPGQLQYRPSSAAAAITAGGVAARTQTVVIYHDANGNLVTCLPGQLTVQAVSEGAAAGTIARQYAFTNSSSFACTLYGYPGMQMLGADNSPLPTTVIRGTPGGTSATPQTVTLAPGAEAYFLLTYPDATGYANLTCPTSSSLEFTPPNDYSGVYLTGNGGQIQPFGGTTESLQCGTITISAVQATQPLAG